MTRNDRAPSSERVEIAATFEEHARTKNLAAARVLCILMAVIMPSGFLLDVLVAREHVGQFMVYRLASSAVALGCLWLSGRPWAARHEFLVGLIPSVCTAFALELMIIELGAHSSTYYGGLTQLVLGVAILVYWRLRHILIAAAIILGVWLIPALAEWRDIYWPVFFNNLYALVIFLTIAVAGSWTRRRSLEREYTAQAALAKTTAELSSALARLRELDQAKNRFFANVSHELRTPITLILAPLDEVLAAEDEGVDPARRAQLSMARRNALKLLRLVDDILELTRLESTAVRLRAEPVDLGRLAADLAERTRALGQRKDLELRANVPEGDFGVVGDPAQIEKVVLNLLANALKFTDDGSVEVGVAEAGDEVEIYVRDTGIGIPRDQLEHVFERFRQVDDGSTRCHSGTGIGLALAKETVALHGGRIAAESEQGQGTTMRVWLPREARMPDHVVERRSHEVVAARERREQRGLPEWHAELRARDDYKLLYVDAATERRIVARPQRSPSREASILVVEDNPDMIQLIVGLLSADYDVLAATDGEQGLMLARKKLPDLVVSDVMMPKMNGFDLVRALREDATTKHIPTILLTARGQVEARIEGREGGADAHLTKPFRPEELRATILDLLKKQGQILESSRDERDAAMRILSEGVAHEILNPLGFVRNAFYALRDAVEELREQCPEPASAGPTELAARIDRLYEAGQEGILRTRTAVEDLRRFAKGSVLPPTIVDVNDVAAQVVSVVSARKGVHVTLELEASAPAFVPPGQIDKILLNLIKNASQAADGDSQIVVRSWNAESGACLAVADQGPGIARDDLEKIFHPYYTTKDPDQGSGLGLALCRQIARDMGGRLDVDSELGVGTTFTLWVPCPTAEQSSYAELRPGSLDRH